MKSKKRHQSSEDDSEDSDASGKSSSSESESEESSASEHRHRKKKKRADSSESDSDSDDHRRSKKRKHKKKKKKHAKRKRRSDSIADSRSDADGNSSVSEGEVSPKKKRKKHKQKRSRSSSGSVLEVERRLHSVVKERRRSSEEEERPARTYYQKDYRSESPIEVLDNQRQREVDRFYRGSSKERRYHEQYQYEQRERHQRNPRYEGQHRQGHPEEYQRRPREENYHSRDQPRGFNNRFNHYEERGPKRNFEGHDFHDRERRGPPEPERFREKEYPERRYNREDTFQTDRPREVRRDKPPPRVERPPPQQHRPEPMRSERVEDRYRERGRRPEPRPDREPDRREERYREGDGRNGRETRPDVREPSRDERRPRDRPEVKPEPPARERKSRFTEAESDKEYSWGKTEVKKEGTKDAEKEKPNFGLSGKLTADANTVNGVVIKYTEPDDAKQPKRRWRFYPFKGDKALPILYIHRQSAFLIGRDKKVCDITLEHPSISKQHAALQYRATPFARPDGSQGRRVRPYVIDLESANGTFVNNKKIEPRRYVELLEKDVVKFGFSAREYVLLHENSKDDAQDDDNQELAGLGAAVTTTDQIKHEKRIKLETVEDGE